MERRRATAGASGRGWEGRELGARPAASSPARAARPTLTRCSMRRVVPRGSAWAIARCRRAVEDVKRCPMNGDSDACWADLRDDSGCRRSRMCRMRRREWRDGCHILEDVDADYVDELQPQL